MYGRSGFNCVIVAVGTLELYRYQSEDEEN